jgi:hypothetical protein
MSDTTPILTFRAAVTSPAAPAAVYEILADPRTHLVWAGERSPRKKFRLLTMDAPAGPAGIGDRFSSSGANINGTFHDSSVVVVADRAERFGFDTDSTLDRSHGREWHVRFTHRYEISHSNGGSRISYACEVRPQNYVPYWLKPGIRTVMRRNVEFMIRKNLENLSVMAEAATVAPGP